MSKVPMVALMEELNVPPRMKEWIEWNFQFADDNMEDIREWLEQLTNRRKASDEALEAAKALVVSLRQHPLFDPHIEL